MTIVDASVVIRMLVSHAADDLLRKRLSPPRRMHAPALIDAEVLNGIRGLLIGGKTTLARGLEMLNDFAEMRIIRHSMTPLHA